MSEIQDVIISWQFLLVGCVVFLIFGFFNGLGSWPGLGFYLWRIKSKAWRQVLRVFEAIKVLFLPLFGFGIGWLPAIPRPQPLQGEEVSTFSVALLYAMAGIGSMFIVKFVQKSLAAKGIDIEIDTPPKKQVRAKQAEGTKG